MLKSYPYDDLVVYEIGAGNGTLACDILDYVRDEHPPEVYERVRYNIVEISPQLAELQRNRLTETHPGVRVFNKSIFDWDVRDNSTCFVIALEVVVSKTTLTYSQCFLNPVFPLNRIISHMTKSDTPLKHANLFKVSWLSTSGGISLSSMNPYQMDSSLVS